MSNSPATRLGMVRCEHCHRQFNPHSAARHIPWCKKQTETRKRHLTADKLEALERYRWRIGYKPSNLISNQSRNFINSKPANRSGQQQQNRQRSQANNHTASRSYKVEEDFQEDEFSGDENSEHDDEYEPHRSQLSAAAAQRSGQTERRIQNGSNSSNTFSSPSASSITSLNNSVGSTTNNNKPDHVRTNANSSKQQRPALAAANRSQHGKLVRSISSVTLNKHPHGSGSASSRNSRVSAATIGAPNEPPSLRFSKGGRSQPRQSVGAGTPRLVDQMRAKSVSDLSNMGEIVETLAKRMEQIYAQNQLLLDSIIRSRLACDSEAAAANKLGNGEVHHDGIEAGDLGECNQCHHCRTRCLVEANYCHRCGCKMRPSNPTPSTPSTPG